MHAYTEAHAQAHTSFKELILFKEQTNEQCFTTHKAVLCQVEMGEGRGDYLTNSKFRKTKEDKRRKTGP